MLLTTGTLIMMSLMTFPAFAQQYRGNRMGPGMMGQGYSTIDRSSLDEEKLKVYDEEMAAHYKDTANQRQEIIVKQHEIATLLVNPKTTKKELLEKQMELQELMNTLQREELSFRWDQHKKYPEMTPDIYGGCLVPAAGYGGGPGMMDYGSYGQDMMDPDGYDDHGYGMMGGYGWRNWKNSAPRRDKSQ